MPSTSQPKAVGKARTPSKASPAGTRAKVAAKDSAQRQPVAASPDAPTPSDKKAKKTPASGAEPRKRKAGATPGGKAAAAAEPAPAPKKSKKAAAAAAAAPAAAAASSAPAATAARSSASAAGPSASVGKLERAQVERAVEALRAYASSKSSGELVGEDACLSIVLATKRMPKAAAGAKAVKPRLLTLPHLWRTLDETEVCLIVKDPQRTVKDMCAAERITAKVIGVEKLKKKYVPFESRRRLRGAYDFFAADARVLPMLPKLLGSEFYKSNKLPLPLSFKRKALRQSLERAVGGAILRPSHGTCVSLACASTSQPTADAADNVLAAVEKVVARTPGKWQNVQAIHLRTVNSAALPIYNAV